MTAEAGRRLTDPAEIAAALDASEARTLGDVVWQLRIAWRYRHDVETPGQRITRRRLVTNAVALLRALRHQIGPRLPILPRRCGDVGTVESRHVWDHRGPRPQDCGCDACREDVGERGGEP